MRILWAAIQEAGALGWVMVVLGELGVVAAFVAVLAPRWRRRMAVAATALGALCAVLGGAGVIGVRIATDRTIAEERDALRPVERLRMRREGYLEAQRPAEIGLGCAALPLLAGVAAALAVTRRRPRRTPTTPISTSRASFGPGGASRFGTAFAAVTASGFAAAARLEPVPGPYVLADLATWQVQDHVTDVDHAADGDLLLHACERLEAALSEHGASFDRGRVPTLPAAARRCVEERIQRAALLAPISAVRSALEDLSRSPFVKHDPAWTSSSPRRAPRSSASRRAR